MPTLKEEINWNGGVTNAERKQWTWVDDNHVFISSQAEVEAWLRDLADRIEDDGLPPLTITLPKR